MLGCNCQLCRRREDMVSRYMDMLGIGYPEAIGVLADEARAFWRRACEHAAECHGLDDEQARAHVVTHAVDPPERMQ